MRTLWQGWWLWWAIVVVTVVAEVTNRREACEVLGDAIPSRTFDLPTNLTVKPKDADWLVDFVLSDSKVSPAPCVRVQHIDSTPRMLLYKGQCEDSQLLDYHYLYAINMQRNVWLSFVIEVKDSEVKVTWTGADPITFRLEKDLTSRALYVNATQGVEVAVGCRMNCPYYHHDSLQPDRRKTVMKSSDREVLFYFRPGKTFIKLEYEVCCVMSLGPVFYQPISDVKVPEHQPLGLWHLVQLYSTDKEVEVKLDYRFLHQKKLPNGCTFKNHSIKLVGDSQVSLCNPSTSGEGNKAEERWDFAMNSQPSLWNSCLTAAAALLVSWWRWRWWW